MAVSAFTVANIKPTLNIDNSQRFVFGAAGAPEPLGSFKFDNIFVPISLAPSQSNHEYRNNTLSGFRWIHTTNSTDTIGSFKLQSFIAGSPTGTDIFLINNAGAINFPAPTSFSNLSISSDLNMNGHKIVNLLDPTNPQDGATKAYVNSIVGTGNLTLSGAVTGTGPLLSPVATVLSSNIITQSAKQTFTFNHPGDFSELILKNLISTPESFTKITTMNSNNRGYSFVHYTNESFPETDVFGAFGLNATYNDILYPFYTCDTLADEDDTRISFLAKKIIISSSSHSGGSNFTFTSNVSIDIGSNKLTNVGDPINPQDAATRAFVLSNIAAIPSGTVTLTGAVAGSGAVGSTITTTLANINTSQITNFNPAVSAFSLNDFQPPVATLDFNDKALTNVKTLFVNEQINLGGTTGLELVRKLFFYNLTGDDYDISGFGYTNTQGTIYHCPLTKKHSFYAGSLANLALEIYSDRLDMKSHKIVNLLDPTNPQDAATRAYVLSSIAAIPSGTVTLTGAVTGSGAVGSTITTTLANINTSQISNFTSAVTAFRLDQFAPPTAALNINSQNLNNINSIGISTSAIGSGRITFPNADSPKKITFYDNSGTDNDYNRSSIGNIGTTTTYNCPLGGSHQFLTGNSSEGLTITASQIYTRNSLDTTNFMRLNMWQDGITDLHDSYGFGVQIFSGTNIVRSQIGNTSASFVWFSGSNSSSVPSSTASNELMRLTGTGNLGIGLSNPSSPLHFPNQSNNRIITLNMDANNQHQIVGLGINTNVFRYQANSTTTDHVFYAGTSSSTSNELARIKGNGDAIIAGNLYANRPCGVLYFQNNATNTSNTANVFTKINGTTTAGGLIVFTMPINNRLQYTGTQTINARILLNASVQHNQILGADILIAIYKNGTIIVPSIGRTYGASSGQEYLISTNSITSMNTNDYIEAFITCSNSSTLTPTYLTMTVCTA